MKTIKYLLACVCIIALPVSVYAQQRTGVNTRPLVTQPVTGVPDKEILIVAVDFEPGGSSGLHTHPGDEHGTVIEGTLMVRSGKDGEFKTLTVGQTFTTPPNTPNELKNTSDKPAKIINVLILEKGKPRSTPVQ